MDQKRLINYKEFGKGQPVIIMHGLFGMLDNWQTIAMDLSKSHRVITVDLRNHGRSFHDDEVGYMAMANDVVDLAKHLDMDNFSVIGHSMGGKTACQLALSHTSLIKQLIVVDILPGEYERGHDDVLTALIDLQPQHISKRSQVREKMLDLTEGDEAIAFFLLKSLKRNKQGGFKWRFNLPALIKGYDEIRGAIGGGSFEGKTLFIAGERSDYISGDRWMEATDLFPNANLEEIPNAGHWVHTDNQEGLLKVLNEFLEK